MVGALGNKIAAPKLYAPEVLEAIPRSAGRQALDGIAPPMCGYDCWHLYELSWLNPKQHPQHGVGVLVIDSDSAATIESKSLKLYLNSLNFHCFESEAEAHDAICTDIARVTGSKVSLVILPPSVWHPSHENRPACCLSLMFRATLPYRESLGVICRGLSQIAPMYPTGCARSVL